MNEQQSVGETVKPAMSLIDALAVLSCSQAMGHRRYDDLKRVARAVVDEHAAPIVAEWPAE